MYIYIYMYIYIEILASHFNDLSRCIEIYREGDNKTVET